MKASEATVEQAMAGVGISIEDPDLFEFNGRWYLFAAEISNPDVSVNPERLDNKNIHSFEYVNEINSLCIRGSITYTDWDGRISKYINRMDNHMTIGCKQMVKKQDGNELEIFEEIARGEESMFIHTFIVQNVGIIDRKNQTITYKIELISTLWYDVCASIAYSNYGSLKSEDKNVYNIVKKLFETDKLNVEPTGFANIAQRSSIQLDYATSSNDSLESALKYLFNRLYLAKNQYESTLKFIAYDPIKNWYKLIDYSDVDTWSTIAKPLILLSLFETQYEEMLFSKNSQMASVVEKPQTEAYKDMFVHDVWNYDKSLNFFTRNSTKFEPKELMSLLNSKSKSLESDKLKMKNKYNGLNPLWFTHEGQYHMQTALWNNDFSIYQSAIDDLMKRDALIVNTDGDITHQPGCVIAVLLDRTIEKVPEITDEQKKELYEKHRQIEGMFQIFKVRHIYKPSTPNPYYTENLVFGRNFVLASSQNDSISKAESLDQTTFDNEFKSYFSRPGNIS